MPGLPLANQPTRWDIVVDGVGDSFTPKTISRVVPGVGAETVYRLLNYTNLGAYQFPTTIEWTESAYPPTSPPSVMSTGITTVISVRMPEQIADSTFRLDEKSAAVVWDSDQRKLTKMPPELARACVKRGLSFPTHAQALTTNSWVTSTNDLRAPLSTLNPQPHKFRDDP
jgi:hypothetical protein